MEVETRDAIVATLMDLRRLLSKSQTEFAKLDEPALGDLQERLDEGVDRLGGLVPGATPPSRIEDFFTQVGEGMAAAQAELDRQSFHYNLDRPEGALPTVLRLPKVQAEIGFTMSRKRSKQFGVFALGRSASGEKRHTNSVSFEIVAVPPAAGATDQIPLGASLVSRLSARVEIKAHLEAAEKQSALSQGAAAAMLADFDRVLVLAHDRAWLLAQVVLVDQGVPASVQFGVLTEEPMQFTSHGPIPASQAEQARWVMLRNFLNTIALRQRDALQSGQNPNRTKPI